MSDGVLHEHSFQLKVEQFWLLHTQDFGIIIRVSRVSITQNKQSKDVTFISRKLQ